MLNEQKKKKDQKLELISEQSLEQEQITQNFHLIDCSPELLDGEKHSTIKKREFEEEQMQILDHTE